MTEEEILERRIELKEQVIVLYEQEKSEVVVTTKEYCKRLEDDIAAVRKHIEMLKGQLEALRAKRAA